MTSIHFGARIVRFHSSLPNMIKLADVLAPNGPMKRWENEHGLYFVPDALELRNRKCYLVMSPDEVAERDAVGQGAEASALEAGVEGRVQVAVMEAKRPIYDRLWEEAHAQEVVLIDIPTEADLNTFQLSPEILAELGVTAKT